MIFGKRPVSVARDREALDSLPRGMRVAGAWSWRILAVVGVVAVFVYLIIQLKLIVVPLMVAVLLAALLVPFSAWLQRHRWPKWLAVAVSELGVIAIIAGLLVLVILQIRGGFPELQARSVSAYENFRGALTAPPFNISPSEFNAYISQAVAALRRDNSALVAGALSIGTTAGHVLTGALLVLFATLFMLIDGRGIWLWVVRLFPRGARQAVDGSGTAGWVTLTTFVRVQIFVAAVDATGIGLVAFFLGLPLVIPIAVAVFLGSFIPVVGAVLTGVIAIFVALIYNGPVAALIMLGGVLLVQQLEGHVLQPLVMGSAVKVHPLAVVLAVAAGGFLAGIPGALFAVPVVATVNVMITSMASGAWRTTSVPSLKDVQPDA